MAENEMKGVVVKSRKRHIKIYFDVDHAVNLQTLVTSPIRLWRTWQARMDRGIQRQWQWDLNFLMFFVQTMSAQDLREWPHFFVCEMCLSSSLLSLYT